MSRRTERVFQAIMIHLIIACLTCYVDGNMTYVSGATALNADVPARGFTCNSNQQLCITDDQNRWFRYNSVSSPPATAVLVPYCTTNNGETSLFSRW